MAKKIKKDESFSTKENKKKPLEVIDSKNIEEANVIEQPGDNIPPSRSIMPVKGFAMPLANVEQIKMASTKYQEFLTALLDEKDIQQIEVYNDKTKKKEIKLTAKKSGFGKIARFWGVSTEIIRSVIDEGVHPKDKTRWNSFNRTYEVVVKAGAPCLTAKAWCKAILPNGQFAVRGAACSEAEPRGFAHIPHDLLATSETRAAKRAIEAVIGMGEIEMDEEDAGENIEQVQEIGQPPKGRPLAKEPEGWVKPVKTPPKTQKALVDEPKEENIEYQGYEVGGVKYYRKIVNGKVFQEGLDANEWKPMFKTRWGQSSVNWKMKISEKQVEFIAMALQKAKVWGGPDDPHLGLDDIIFVLNNRIDGVPRHKELKEFDRGDASDVIDTIKDFGKEALLNLLEK